MEDRNRAAMDRWRGHVAVVTGASSGIGRVITLGLLKAGMRVAVCARRLEAIGPWGGGRHARCFFGMSGRSSCRK